MNEMKEEQESIHPMIIQGGMGIGVSDWKLARAVSMSGELGVISGTCIDTLLIRRLQEGDATGRLREAMKQFPLQDVATQVGRRFFIEGGKSVNQPYRLLSMYQAKSAPMREKVTVLASFVEVTLAKMGHQGRVGINLLTKIQAPTLATLYGAMLAGVDYVLMGAGIPKEIPGILDRLSRNEAAELKLDCVGASQDFYFRFDPSALGFDTSLALKRPYFFAVVSSHSLATMLAKKATGRVDGFIVEHHSAGGHNAPPRQTDSLSERGEPIYGERDEVDISKIRSLGLPFWKAGSCGSPEALLAARAEGAHGIQVGTLFAFCNESGISPELKRQTLELAKRGEISVFTDPRGSPTGYPFKVVNLANTLSEEMVYDARPRNCDLGYLRVAYMKEDGNVGFRCSGELIDDYLKKGGKIEDTPGRKCLCNALFANIGHGQKRAEDFSEPALLTSGDQIAAIQSFLSSGLSYNACEVIDYLHGRTKRDSRNTCAVSFNSA